MITLPSTRPQQPATFDDIDAIARYILDPDRERALLIVTTRKNRSTPDINLDGINEMTHGRLDLVALRDDVSTKWFADRLAREHHPELSVYRGAARLFPRLPQSVRDGCTDASWAPLFYTDTDAHRKALMSQLMRLADDMPTREYPQPSGSIRQVLRATTGTPATRYSSREPNGAPNRHGDADQHRPSPRGDTVPSAPHHALPHDASEDHATTRRQHAQAVQTPQMDIHTLRIFHTQELIHIHTASQARQLVTLLLSPQRTLPVVIISNPNNTTPIVKFDYLTDGLRGLAYTVRITDADAIRALESQLHRSAWVFGNAGRIYPPGTRWNGNGQKLDIYLQNPHVSAMLLTNLIVRDTLLLTRDSLRQAYAALAGTADMHLAECAEHRS